MDVLYFVLAVKKTDIVVFLDVSFEEVVGEILDVFEYFGS